MIILNIMCLITILILLYLLIGWIFRKESFVVRLVHRSVHQDNIELEQINTLVDCLDMILQNPDLISWDLTEDIEVIEKLYYALLDNNIIRISNKVDEIIENLTQGE